MTEAADTLDQQVRTADLDRWLSSRLVADARARADLITLYAFETELMTIPTRVTQPLLAEMRYTWWAEQMDGVFAGVPRKGHPMLEALTDVVARHGLDRAPFDALIEAHIGRVREEPHDLDAFYVGPMQVGGQRYTVAGRVCMDQVVLDLGPESTAQAGDEVVLIGREADGEPTAQDWAAAIDTINYEIVARLGPRVPRRYLEGA